MKYLPRVMIFSLLSLLLCFSCTKKAAAETQQSLNGIWRSNTKGYLEQLGHYDFLVILTIQNEKYTWMEERISEKAMFWSAGHRGTFSINNSELTFFQEERTFGQWELRWEIEDRIEIYTFIIENNELTLTQGSEEIVFEKDI